MAEPGSSGYLIPPPRSREAIRNWDARAIRDYAIPGILLMENAGEGCVRKIEELLLEPPAPAPPFHIVCGFGNNAGDGFVIARHLANRGYPVEIHLTAPADRIAAGSDAGINLEIARRMGISLAEPGSDLEEAIRRGTSGGVIVDALFGSGLSGPVRPPQSRWIDAMNRSGLPVLAIDIPSGLEADSGEELGFAIRATHTFTFVAPKLGFERGAGPECCGRLHVIGISIPRALLEESTGEGEP